MHIGREAETALIIIMTTSVTIAAAVLADRRARRRVARVAAQLGRRDARLVEAGFADGYVRGLQRRPSDGDGPHLYAV